MSEEEIINTLKNFRNYNKFYKEKDGNLTITIDHSAKDEIDKAIQGLLDLYQKEKEKNKSLEQENVFLKQLYSRTEEFKRIERMANNE